VNGCLLGRCARKTPDTEGGQGASVRRGVRWSALPEPNRMALPSLKPPYYARIASVYRGSQLLIGIPFKVLIFHKTLNGAAIAL
jgi:hypothetical protein